MKNKSFVISRYLIIVFSMLYALYRFIETVDFSFFIITNSMFLCIILTFMPDTLEGLKDSISIDTKPEYKKPDINSYIKELDETKEELNKKNRELTKFFDEIQYGYLQTVMSLANSIEAMDAYTGGHCQRVMEISCEVARALGLNDGEIEDLRYAAILHDIGKIGIPANILNKQGKLTDDEYNEIKKHPEIAYNILKDVKFLKKGLDGILQHHERYDGNGYPNGLKGNEISIFGRIMCIADAFDAMTSDRPYRKGMKVEDAMNELERCKNSQFDPDIVDLFIGLMSSDESRNFAEEY